MAGALAAPRAQGRPVRLRVVVLDVGGSSVKLSVGGLSAQTIPSGPAMTPRRLVRESLAALGGREYDAVSLGYPGPVRGGRLLAEPRNLGTGWRAFDFERAFGRPVRIVNDAAMQALGAYRGGVMLFLGLGTGLGTALVTDGAVVAMEMGQLRLRGRRTLEDDLGARGLARLGQAAWRRAVAEVVAALSEVFVPDEVVLGGGNVNRLATLPHGARRGSNEDALRGGLLLWNDGAAPRPRALREEAACSGRTGSR